MSQETRRFTNRVRTCCLGICALAWMGAVAAGCSDGNDEGGNEMPAPPMAAGAGAGAGTGSPGSSGTGGGQPPTSSGMQAGQGEQGGQAGQAGSGSMAGEGSAAAGGTGAAGDSEPGSGCAAGDMVVEATCGPNDTPETGLQGDVYSGTVNCGLTLLSQVPGGGSVQGSGHCAYVRSGGMIRAYSLADPRNPMETDQEPTVGASESMRARTVGERAVLASGGGVYDISNCEDIVKKGEIPWPSANYQAGLYVAAINGHEIAISHDAKRVYSGVGFGLAQIENLEQPDTWTVKNWTCEMNVQSGMSGAGPSACEGPSPDDFAIGRSYSHSSDDNLEGTVWYGTNQLTPVTGHMVDISDPNSIEILDVIMEVPGHSMNWWRTPSGRDYIIGANEGGVTDSCVEYPRPTALGNALDAYIVEVTGNVFGEPFPLTLDINKPENCDAAKASGGNAVITEQSIYNDNCAAFVMIEFGRAGLRVFDLRDGDNPKEVAYYNDGRGHVHSGVFHYEASRGIMLASGSQGMQVLVLQPQMLAALGLPTPTDPDYPYE